jgi:hypothetical protein
MSDAVRPKLTYTGKVPLKLYHGDKLIGTVTDLDSDYPWYGGKIQLTDAAKEFAHIWEFFTSEGGREKEPPFEIADEVYENWSIVDEKGLRVAIFDLPAVHSDGEVWWTFEPSQD